MDYCFMRSDLGYDVIMLAMKDENQLFKVFMLGDEETKDQLAFTEETEQKLLERARMWCKEHLSDEEKMQSFSVSKEDYHHVKKYLQVNQLTYEVKKHRFFVRKSDYNRVQQERINK